MTIHNTKEWKLKSNEFKKEKVCDWCGSDENLQIHHPNGKHTNSRAIYSQAYYNFCKMHPRKRVTDKKTGKITYPKTLTNSEFKTEYEKYKKEINIDKLIENAHIKYMSFEGCIVLCRKCHWYAEKGLTGYCPDCNLYKNDNRTRDYKGSVCNC